MANHSSTKKAIRKTVRVSEINKNRKSRVKTYVKRVLASIKNGSAEDAKNSLVAAQSEIMKATSKKIFKKNTAARKIARLSKMVKNFSLTTPVIAAK